MGLVGTNSQGVATSVLAEWVKKVSDLPMPEADKAKLDEYIDDIYNKVSECEYKHKYLILVTSIISIVLVFSRWRIPK